MALLAVEFGLTQNLVAQQADSPSTNATIQSRSTLVRVPTLVQAPSGELVYQLKPEDFLITDNGRPQSPHIDYLQHESLALIVLMQIGGPAPRQFVNYTGFSTLLEQSLSFTSYNVSLVTFDSKPEQRWPFVTRVSRIADGLSHPPSGDDGAAIADALDYALDWFDNQHVTGHRVILLISQPQMGSSQTPLSDVLRRISDTGTSIYTLTFSPEKTWVKDQFTKPRHGEPPYFFGVGHPPLNYVFDLGTPLAMAAKSLQKSSVASLSNLSGAESFEFNNRSEFENKLATLGNHLPNGYNLSYQPSTSVGQDLGFHRVTVTIPAHPCWTVHARTGYWNTPAQGCIQCEPAKPY